MSSIAIASAETLSSPPPDLQGEAELEHLKISYALRQQPVSVTLDGKTIFLSSLVLVLLIHFLDPYHAEVVIALFPIVLGVHNDYQNFLNLGPGGTPSTFSGYLRISWFRLWALSDPFAAPEPDHMRLPTSGILRRQRLPYRAGPRPVVAGIAPQRQLDQHGSRVCYRALRWSMAKLANRSPKKFGTEKSCIEKHGLALFARHPVQTNCQGEICHVHDSDHSMHMCLHPDDIREVLEKGWGQRHPLAWRGRFLKSPVSPDFVMIYAPRDDEELQVICNIIEAAIWYTVAEELEMGICPKPM
ncbi:uncharacterized protein FMAN_00914 [Fusarium mangiferae]|uniref:Luciferase domain-containing protein n=1 Tax=Fusarium mangiferae TaxID=192010 RepID=A0A1L7SK89_FUSMA|nr:uncharacterized protein FMAN_00914 [Fusarium mangiferae]KAI1030969.1 hypothetical protein LB504_001030 [Fusarium proliferatum]CVK83482.1 uncharacterized protein FMAN_00914 [Fusarium mangiferae]